jgi:short subunit dehydrogenase-like uncharacterized protein
VLAVLGATGYTGRLVVDEARRAGLPVRLVGRRREALDELARPGEEVAVADAADEEALRRAFDGASVVASVAGPFLEVGFAPVRTAIEVGAHYVDITGEQPFTQRVYEELGPLAAARGVALLSAFGMDYVPGDLAARIAAEALDGPLDEVVAAYSFARSGQSGGTRRTVALMAGRAHVARVDGALVESELGATSRTVAFPFGDAEVIEWPGTEPLTVPRHTDVATVRSYARLPKAAAKAAPVLRPALELRAKVGGDGPSPEERSTARFAVVAEARRGEEVGRATLVGSDPYGFTALAVVTAARALAGGEVTGAGALAPAEAFDARSLAARLGPLLQLQS